MLGIFTKELISCGTVQVELESSITNTNSFVRFG